MVIPRVFSHKRPLTNTKTQVHKKYLQMSQKGVKTTVTLPGFVNYRLAYFTRLLFYIRMLKLTGKIYLEKNHGAFFSSNKPWVKNRTAHGKTVPAADTKHRSMVV